MTRRAIEVPDIDGVIRTLKFRDVMAALDDDDIEEEADVRGLKPEPEIEDMSVGDMIESLEAHGYTVTEDGEGAEGHASYVQAALRVALADPNTPREYRDLLYFVHGCIIP